MKGLGEELARELARFGPAAGGMADIVRAWPAAVGPAVAENAWPARLAPDGTLHVAASSAVWAFELGQLAPTLLEQLRASLGAAAPRAVRFRVGPLPEPGEPPREARARRLPAPGPEELDAARGLAAEIEDDELRALVARAAAASLVRGASDR